MPADIANKSADSTSSTSCGSASNTCTWGYATNSENAYQYATSFSGDFCALNQGGKSSVNSSKAPWFASPPWVTPTSCPVPAQVPDEYETIPHGTCICNRQAMLKEGIHIGADMA